MRCVSTFRLSTKPVENFVGKNRLTGLNARFDAGFNNLPIPGAKKSPLKINKLQSLKKNQKNFVKILKSRNFVHKYLKHIILASQKAA